MLKFKRGTGWKRGFGIVLIDTPFKPGDLVRLVSEPRHAQMERLIGQPSIVMNVDDTFSPPRFIVAVFDPARRDVERIRCRFEDLEPIRVNRS
ncbi:MAG: hypothetical protein VKN33_02190 [Candidatus Sericytochromatia bacterium]|nr:hypothetical protein [Candidatus Sericytochromatia bacterium]